MRKFLTALPAAALVFASLAAADTTSTEVGVTVSVKNVCTYNVPDMQNVNGLTYHDSNTITMDYDAISGGSAHTAYDYIFRCTKGTSFGTPVASFAYTSLSSGPAITATIDHQSDTNTSNGDIHSYGVQLTAANNQFNVPAGTYSGTLTTTVNYN